LRYSAHNRGHVAWFAIGVIFLTTFGSVALPARAQGDESSPIGLRGSIVAGGIGTFAEDRWALVRANVINRSDTDREVRVVYSFDVQPDRQFVRRTWVPANATRRVEWPARLARVGEEDKSADGRAMVLDADSETSYGDQPGTVIVLRDEALTAAIAGGDAEADRAIDGVLAVRETAGLSRRLIYPSQLERHGPRYTLGWEPARVVVLATPTVDLDPARARALRRWIRSGGTLWVMADRVEPGVLAEVLGDDWAVAEVDRVGLNQVKFDDNDGGRPAGDDQAAESVIREQPITMTRVIAPDYRTVMSVRGWPALLERNVGGGRIVVTTVGPRGWDAENAGGALRLIAETIYPRPNAAPSADGEDDAAARFIESQIGYEVASRATVAGVLGTYVVAVVLLGLLLLARGKGEWIGLYGIGASVVATLLLGGLGMASRGKVQPTNATFQTVHVDPGSSVATVTGAIGMFAPFEREASLASRRGGWAWPRGGGGAGATRRLMWTDLDYWTWRRLPLSGGRAERMDFATTAEFPEQVQVDLRYTEAGLVGRISTGGAATLSDMMLLTGQAAMAVRRTGGDGPEAEIAIGPDSILPAGSFITADVLTVTEQRRSEVLADLAAHRSPDQPPVILGWSDLIDDGLTGDDDMPARGAAIWHVPLNAAEARPGDRVTVPWPLVTMTPVRNIEGLRQSGLNYNPATGEWLATSLPGSFAARFDLPDAVSPLQPRSATLVLDINAVGRPVTVRMFDGGRPIDLARIEGPDGPQRIELPTDQIGGAIRSLTLAIDVGDLTDPTQGMESQSAMWKINRVGLEIGGIVGR